MAIADRKIPIGSNSWLSRCEEKFVYDHDIKASIRFYDAFEIPSFEDDFEREAEFVVEGKVRLDVLANKYYNSPLLWWVIAARNDMDLPDADLFEGMILKIPSKDFVMNKVIG